eukprot:JZ548727.1.p2 GENE.JZ548727.1~~JZ548727.1.p2  ORF type:complete len:122 (+),score=44.31 JZ548727.1:28-393(+)
MAAEMNVPDALKKVLQSAVACNGLARGLREVTRVLDKKTARFCVLADSCDEPAYTKLVEALCKEHGIHLLKVPDSKILGEWAGLCKYDAEGKARNVVACSCVAVVAVEQSAELDYIMAQMQ